MSSTTLNERVARTALAKQWARIGLAHHHGIDLPLSALHSQYSCGIGEFFDLIPLIDWCHKLKMDVIQLLPLNDSGDDPSPYFAISSCALNPLYLSLHKLPYIEASNPLLRKLEELRRLTLQSRIVYADVQSHKLSWLREYFEKFGNTLLKSKNFQTHLTNHPWVERYALFKAIKASVSKNHWMKSRRSAKPSRRAT